MSIHWITFRLDSAMVGGKTYETRYQALIDAVNKHVTDAWDEPTSFWIVESASTQMQIASTIKAAIAPSKDLVLIGSMDTMGATLIGTATKLAALKRLVPKLLTS